MPYCHKCGSEVTEDMSFCPKCGASLKAPETAVQERYRREKVEKEEKQEKQEKEEKTEKEEKHEKGEYGVLAPLVGGIILILIGFLSYLTVSGMIEVCSVFPFFLIVVGATIIVGVVVGAAMARQRNPMP